jgi:Ssp1 endopeptidase immunity protein Rap1a
MLHHPSWHGGSLMRAVLLGLLAAVLPAFEGAAEPESANSMLPGCQTFISRVDPGTAGPQSRCVGNVEGLAFVSSLLPANLKSCTPDNVTLGQVVRVVVAYIERRPQRMHEYFNFLALEAMHEAWPCK